MIAPTQGYLLKVPDSTASRIRKLHPDIKSQIRRALQSILQSPDSGKALKEELRGLRSYRINRYRIIYRVNPRLQHIEIVAIGPRRIIYEETVRILANQEPPPKMSQASNDRKGVGG